jgi:anhydro-N-acetylmuramic acid kinase
MAGSLRVIGLMSGTSMDGIDVAVIETDGERVGWTGPSRTFPYSPSLRGRLDRAVRSLERSSDELAALERDLTDAHASAVQDFVPALPPERRAIDLAGCRSARSGGWHSSTPCACGSSRSRPAWSR